MAIGPGSSTTKSSISFAGEILGLSGGADFYGKNPKELRAEFRRSLQVFLEVCAEKGIAPRRHFSGKFNLRISPELHEKLAIAAEAEGKSINTLAHEALQEARGFMSRLPTVCERA